MGGRARCIAFPFLYPCHAPRPCALDRNPNQERAALGAWPVHHIPGNHDVDNNGRVTTLPGVTPHAGKLSGVTAYVGGGLTSWRDTLGNRTGTPGRVSPR